MLLSSEKYDTIFSSRMPDPDFFPSRIRIQGSKRHRIPDPQHWRLVKSSKWKMKRLVDSGNPSKLWKIPVPIMNRARSSAIWAPLVWRSTQRKKTLFRVAFSWNEKTTKLPWACEWAKKGGYRMRSAQGCQNLLHKTNFGVEKEVSFSINVQFN